MTTRVDGGQPVQDIRRGHPLGPVRLMEKLVANPRKELMTFTGGVNHGDPCEGRAYHGFNGIEREVVEKIAAWIVR